MRARGRRGRRRTSQSAVLGLAVAWVACGTDDAEPDSVTATAPENDAGARVDAGVRRSAPRPDDGPRFPATDHEVTLATGDQARVMLRLEAGVGALDVQLSIDTTESMSEEIDNLQRELAHIIVPGLAERVADVRFGVSRFEDFPSAPFGFSGEGDLVRADVPFRLVTPITSDHTRVAGAVALLDRPLGLGGDLKESSAEALWQIATGKGYRQGGETIIEPFRPLDSETGRDSIGGVGFRDGALRVVLHVTDAPSHAPRDYAGAYSGTHSLEDAAKALAAIDARVVGIVTRACEADACSADQRHVRGDLELVAARTGSVEPVGEDGMCAHGVGGTPVPPYGDTCPLVYDVEQDGARLSDTLVDAIAALVDTVRFDQVHGEANADPLGFVERIVAVEVRQAKGVAAPEMSDVFPPGDPDGELDTFLDVRNKAALGFEVLLRNRHVTPKDVTQRFRVVVRIVGDGVVLQERVLGIVVPASGDPAAAAQESGDADAG